MMIDDDSNVTIKEIYTEILKNRTELKNSVQASESRILLRLEDLKARVTDLEKENKHLKDKVEHLDKELKKKNIVIFGLEKTTENISLEFICQKLKALLGVEVNTSDVSDFFPLGKSVHSPIKVEFVSQITKSLILKNCFKLKGTNIGISHDLTQQQREENRILRKHLKRTKEDPSSTCFLKNNKLYINNKPYTAEELEEKEYNSVISPKKPDSAPPTPTIKYIEKPAEGGNQAQSTTPKIPEVNKVAKKQKVVPQEARSTRQRILSNTSHK